MRHHETNKKGEWSMKITIGMCMAAVVLLVAGTGYATPLTQLTFDSGQYPSDTDANWVYRGTEGRHSDNYQTGDGYLRQVNADNNAGSWDNYAGLSAAAPSSDVQASFKFRGNTLNAVSSMGAEYTFTIGWGTGSAMDGGIPATAVALFLGSDGTTYNDRYADTTTTDAGADVMGAFHDFTIIWNSATRNFSVYYDSTLKYTTTSMNAGDLADKVLFVSFGDYSGGDTGLSGDWDEITVTPEPTTLALLGLGGLALLRRRKA